MNKITSFLLGAVFTLCLTAANLTAAPTQKIVDLGNAAHFAVLSYAGVTNAGDSVITGDLGTSPSTSVTGFPPGKVIGTIYTPTEVCTSGGVCKPMKNDVAALGESSLLVAYLDAEGRTLDPVDVTGENLAGKNLTPGLYKSTSTLEIVGGDLTLSGNGVYIFQVTSGLTVSTAKVILKDGATAENVFWQVGSSATLGTYCVFEGNILAYSSVTIATGTTVNGRALALNGDVTLEDNDITKPNGPGF